VQLVISHPNHSGLAMDQATRQFTPAHFVRQVEVSHAGRPVLSADLDFAISENPNLWFWFAAPPGSDGAELKVEMSDSQGLTFETITKVKPMSQ
jgi:sulfur-oxidizing protein SoxY